MTANEALRSGPTSDASSSPNDAPREIGVYFPRRTQAPIRFFFFKFLFSYFHYQSLRKFHIGLCEAVVRAGMLF